MDGSDVRGELRLKKRAFQHVGMGNGYFAPRFHRFLLQSNAMSFEEAALCFITRYRIGRDLYTRPGSNEFVVCASVLSPALPLAECVETVGELAGGFGLTP